MNAFSIFFLLVAIFFGRRIQLITCETKQYEDTFGGLKERFTETKVTESSANKPGIFNLFSDKTNYTRPQINFFLNENINLGLHRSMNNEKTRNMRKRFADFQELRQSDILRFQELMIVQNEQINMLKNIILSFQK